VSAELEIRALLQDGLLPEERECLRCGIVTPDVCRVLVVCERVEVQQPTGWSFQPLWLLLGWVVFSRPREGRERGRDVSFRLPLRVCRECAGQLRRSTLVEVLRQVPVYARLLDKYPHAEVQLERE
jgi:hypothetical protein